MYRYSRPHIPVTHVRVSTAAFEAAHGVMPDGRALWSFTIGGDTLRWYGPYAEAEAQAVAAAARRGICEVVVCA